MVLEQITEALSMAFAMGWVILWSLILGFGLSAAIQAVVSHKQMSRLLPNDKPKTLMLATALGAASSSCSYAAAALSRSMFRKGANFTAAMAFEIASTNLVIELGIILALMLGWRFTLAEFVGGPLMIVILAVLFRRFMTPRLLAAAKRQAEKGIAGRMEEHAAMEDMSVTGNRSVFAKLFSKQGMTATSHYFVMDWSSIWTDIVLGLLIAGAITAWVPMEFFQKLFLTSHPLLSSLWGPLIGPLIAVIAFVCSIGNVPLAAVLWNGGISFGGVIAFIFADLIVFPIVRIYFKYYGAKMAAFLFLTFYTAMAVAGFGVEMLFKLTGLLPQTRDATVLDPSVSLNYTTVLNVVFIALSALLVWRYMTTRMHHHHMSSHSHH